jgi:hypothetical protein
MKTIVKHFPELLHIWLPSILAGVVIFLTPNIDHLAAQFDAMPYVQGVFIALCIVMFNNLFVNLAIKFNFKAEWEEYTKSSLEGHSYAPWQFYCLWAFLHVMFVTVELLVL